MIKKENPHKNAIQLTNIELNTSKLNFKSKFSRKLEHKYCINKFWIKKLNKVVETTCLLRTKAFALLSFNE